MKKLKICIWQAICGIFTHNVGKLNFKQHDRSAKVERITLSSNKVKGNFNSYSGMSGEYWISIVPSLNTSGYGSTEEESVEDLRDNLEIFLEYLLSLPDARRQVELRRMGWSINRYFNKRFSNDFIDSDGVLKNFDDPDSVKTSRLQTA